ncbi:MAG: glycosyltransferase [Paracoccaceae bacterium]
MSPADICFLATSKSGLGHLRRSATIASRLSALAPGRRLHLISNARPEGLQDHELRTFETVQVVERDRMAEAAARTGAGVLVLDTMTVPGIEQLGLPLALVLRETPDDQLHRFCLAGRRPWDLVVIANPEDHWMPNPAALAARSVVPAGWIYRPTGRRRGTGGTLLTVLVATGGGGTAETARALYAEIDVALSRARCQCAAIDVVQAIGPRAQGFGQLAEADRKVDPGGALNDLFREADIVISTAGYNSVLELATTDTPTLLVPIPRSIDDQTARAMSWAKRLGTWLDPASPDSAITWLTQEVATRRRRPPVDLGPSGEDRAARAILTL